MSAVPQSHRRRLPGIRGAVWFCPDHYFLIAVGAVGSVGFTGVLGADSGGMVGGIPGRIGSGLVGSIGRTPGAGDGGFSGVAV